MRKPTPRRRFLLASSLVTLGVGSTLGFANRARFSKSQRTTNKPDTLSSVIDTILPVSATNADLKDALDLTLDAAIRQLAIKKPRFSENVNQLIQIIENAALSQYQQPFVGLGIDQRESLLTKMLTQKTQPLARRKLLSLRNAVINIFYTSASGRAHLGYQLPANYANY
jgi:hypothetical protein